MGTSAKGSLIDMLLPIGSLIFFAVVALLYSGGYWGSDPAYHTLAAAFGNSSASKALVWASFGAITVAFFLFVPRGLMSLKSFMDCAGEGMKAMMPANTILVLAWTISGVCRDLPRSSSRPWWPTAASPAACCPPSSSWWPVS
jgi:tetracycline resistance efflux pump